MIIAIVVFILGFVLGNLASRLFRKPDQSYRDDPEWNAQLDRVQREMETKNQDW